MKRALLAVLALAVAVAAFGDDVDTHPNNQKGFAPDRVYDTHDIDTVNLFNGNLIVRIPIGQQYTVNGRAPFSLALTYNSHAWQYAVTPPPIPELQHFPNVTATPQKDDNAGMGWRLSLGVGNPDFYTSPDGAKHLFYYDLHSGQTLNSTTRYTRDGTYLRMRKEGDSLVHIDFPDGTTRSYTQLQPVPHPGIGDWQVSNTSAKWFLTEIVEPFSNYVEVEYKTDATYGAIWTLTDPARTTTVYFKDGMTSDFDFTLDHIDAVGVNGALAQYSFAYQLLSVPPGFGDNTTVGNITVPVLTGITLPAGNGYSMIANGAPAYSSTAATSAVLTRVVLPTLGSVGWSYDTRDFADGVRDGPRSPAIEYPAGVTGRTKYNPDGSSYAAWSYGMRFSPSPSCQAACPPGQGGYCTSGRSRQLAVWVTDPPTDATSDVRTTISYFSNYEHVLDPGGDTCSTAAEGWLTAEHGLPFTRYAAQNGRFLSSEVRTGFDVNAISSWNGQGQMPVSGTPVRETWVSYDLDCDASTGKKFDKNASLAATRTNFLDDHACGTAGNEVCYTAASSFNNDGYGHYRQTSTDGNFRRPEDGSVVNGGNFRTTFTNYNPDAGYSAGSCAFSTPIGPLQKWILNTSTESCVVDETAARSGGLSQCAALPNAFITKTQYDAAKGTLTAKRTLRQTADVLDSTDLLSTYQYDNYGNLKVQRDYGAEAQPLDTGTTFSTTTPATYTVTHSQEPNQSFGGVVLKNTVTYSNGVVASDETYDKSTGKVTATRDISGLSTGYSYDLLGRVTGVSPPGAAATTYTYSDASFSGGAFTPAKVLAVTNGASSGIGTVKKEYQFDAFGRLWRAKSLLDDGTWSIVQNTFDVLGRTTASSTPEKLSTQESAFQPAHNATYSAFDAADRPRTSTAPDGTARSFAFAGVRQTTRSVNVPVGGVSTTVTVTEIRDPQGRLVQVQEPSGTTSSTSPVGAQTSTYYRYDSANHLALVKTTSGNVTQQRSFTYDGRGFLLQEQHPELGDNAIQYVYSTIGYDARGHALGKRAGTTANGLNDVRLAFDESERLTDVWDQGDQHRRLKQFFYWTANDNASPPNLAAGKLYQAIRTNHLPGGDIVVTETYTYATPEQSGRASKRDTRVTSANGTTLQLFSQAFHYDPFGASSQIDYPACDAGVPCGAPPVVSVPFTRYNGFLKAVGSHASSISYNPDGTVNTVTHGSNGSAAVDTYAPDPSGMSRPSSITFAGMCTPPTAAVSGGGTIAQGGTATIQASLTGTGPWTITWSDQQIQTTSQNPATRTVSPNATTQYTITALTDATGCAGSSTGSATVTVSSCTAPVGTVSGNSTIASGSSATIYASLTGTAPWTITWSDGQSQTTSANPAPHTVWPASTTQYSITGLHDGNGCVGSGSGSATVTVVNLSPPAAFVATTNQNSTLMVSLQWSTGAGATWYQVERATRITANDWSAIATRLPSLSASDQFQGAVSSTTYLYRVRSGTTVNNTDVVSLSASPLDYATVATALFSDEPLVAGSTRIRGIHIGELRRAIDAVRYAAGLLPAWSSYAALSGTIGAVENNEARARLDDAVHALLGHNLSYSGETPAANGLIRAYQIQQIRDGVR